MFGSKTRRLEEKEERRKLILDVAKEIAIVDGWQNLTIRKICNKINYTAPVIYQYFENKDGILLALKKDGFTSVLEQFEAVVNKTEEPEKRLFEFGMVWWSFSKNNPELYQVMFNLQGAVCMNYLTKANKSVVEYYIHEFEQINKSVEKTERLKLELCDNLIALIHGFISMRMFNKIKSGNSNADNSYKKALMLFINSIKDKN